MQGPPEAVQVILGAALIASGAILLVAARDKDRNAFTRAMFELCTFLPRIGSMRDDVSWVRFNGFVLVAGGTLALIASFLF
jgi:hypothetical protein